MLLLLPLPKLCFYSLPSSPETFAQQKPTVEATTRRKKWKFQKEGTVVQWRIGQNARKSLARAETFSVSYKL